MSYGHSMQLKKNLAIVNDKNNVVLLRTKMRDTLLIVDDIRKQSLFLFNNKEERYSRVPRLSDTRYLANGTKGKWRHASSKARLKSATYWRWTDLSVMGVRVGVSNFFLDQSIGIDETNTFQLSNMKIVGATGLGGLWALKWAWQIFFWSIDRY